MPNEFVPQDGPLPGPAYPGPPIVYPPVREIDPKMKKMLLEMMLERLRGGSKTLGTVDSMPNPHPEPSLQQLFRNFFVRG